MSTKIAFNGIDNCGKTSIINRVRGYLESEGVNCYVPGNLITYSSLFPPTLEERSLWYQNAAGEEIIDAFIDAQYNREQDISGKSGYVLLDRGKPTITSSCLARLLIRGDKKLYESLKNEETKMESSIDVYLGFGDSYIGTIEKREGKRLEKSFRDYLSIFHNELDSRRDEMDILLNAEDSININYTQLLQSLR